MMWRLKVMPRGKLDVLNKINDHWSNCEEKLLWNPQMASTQQGIIKVTMNVCTEINETPSSNCGMKVINWHFHLWKYKTDLCCDLRDKKKSSHIDRKPHACHPVKSTAFFNDLVRLWHEFLLHLRDKLQSSALLTMLESTRNLNSVWAMPGFCSKSLYLRCSEKRGNKSKTCDNGYMSSYLFIFLKK